MKKVEKRRAMTQVNIVEKILNRWDPMGVMFQQRDYAHEYDSYAPHIVSLIGGGCSLEQLSFHLNHIRTEVMGMPANTESDKEIAAELLKVIRE